MSVTQTQTSLKVSIIILNWNGLADTVECLESLKKVTYPNYDIILVDNASKGDDVKVLGERFGDYIHIIRNESNLGFAKGNNIGIRYALDKGADYVLLLNNDTTVDPEFLTEMVKVAESDEKIGILCPKMYQYSQPDQLLFDGGVKIDLWRGTLRGEPIQDNDQPVMETEFASGAAMMIRASTLEQIGLLPEEYFFGVEDVDYSLMALGNRSRIAVARRARVLHKVSSTAGASMDVTGIGFHVHKGWQILRRKYLSTPAYYLSSLYGSARAALLSLALLLRHLRHGDFRQSKILLRDLAGSFRGLVAGLSSPRSSK